MKILKKGKVVGVVDDGKIRTKRTALRELFERTGQLNISQKNNIRTTSYVRLEPDDPEYLDVLEMNLVMNGYELAQ